MACDNLAREMESLAFFSYAHAGSRDMRQEKEAAAMRHARHRQMREGNIDRWISRDTASRVPLTKVREMKRRQGQMSFHESSLTQVAYPLCFLPPPPKKKRGGDREATFSSIVQFRGLQHAGNRHPLRHAPQRAIKCRPKPYSTSLFHYKTFWAASAGCITTYTSLSLAPSAFLSERLARYKYIDKRRECCSSSPGGKKREGPCIEVNRCTGGG